MVRKEEDILTLLNKKNRFYSMEFSIYILFNMMSNSVYFSTCILEKRNKFLEF